MDLDRLCFAFLLSDLSDLHRFIFERFDFFQLSDYFDLLGFYFSIRFNFYSQILQVFCFNLRGTLSFGEGWGEVFA
jgi:hypothetical protein